MAEPNPTKTTLTNGLVLITVEKHDVPLVATSMLYRAGSIHEPVGKTGLAHLMEHMMFRGTTGRPQGTIDSDTARVGGFNNAITTADHAIYYFLVPSDDWRLPLEIEADRMMGCLLEPRAFETERRIAIEERMMDEDDPEARLDEAIDLLAFTRHPYRRAVIGRLDDMRRLTVDDLAEFHGRWYAPDNAVLVVVGDVVSAEVEDLAGRLFGGKSPASPSAPDVPAEPEQTEPRHATIAGGCVASQVVSAFHIPDPTSPDAAALEVLTAMLSTGRSSRLHRKLVTQARLANDVAAFKVLLRHPSLLYVWGELLPGVAPDRFEEELLAALGEFGSSGVDIDEVETAKAQARIAFAQTAETASGLAELLGVWESLGGWELAFELEHRIETVREEDVARVARVYLDGVRRSTVWMVPDQKDH